MSLHSNKFNQFISRPNFINRTHAAALKGIEVFLSDSMYFIFILTNLCSHLKVLLNNTKLNLIIYYAHQCYAYLLYAVRKSKKIFRPKIDSLWKMHKSFLKKSSATFTRNVYRVPFFVDLLEFTWRNTRQSSAPNWTNTRYLSLAWCHQDELIQWRQKRERAEGRKDNGWREKNSRQSGR